MDFSAFDTRKMDDYSQQAKAAWGKTDAYKEFEQRDKQYTKADRARQNEELMALMARFGEWKHLAPESAEAQALVHALRTFITDHFYTCTVPILSGLGQWYCGGGSITENIDQAGGPGTAAFAAKAIAIYCQQAE